MLTVTGPYHVESPRYSGEHYAVTVKGPATIRTRGFKTPEEAGEYAKAARKAPSMAQLVAATTPVQGALLTPTILVAA